MEVQTLEMEVMTAPEMKQLIVWDDFRQQAEKLKATAETLTVTSVDQVPEMKLARATRLTIKNLRIAITKRHQELKASVLEQGRKIDGGKNELLKILEPLEERLLLQETFAERETERIRTGVRQSRTAELTPYLTAPVIIDLAVLTDAEYSGLLRDYIASHAAKIEREKAELQAIETAKRVEAERLEAQRIENEKLRALTQAQEAAARAAQIERLRLEKQIADERKAAQAKADAEANRLKAEKLAAIAKVEAAARAEQEKATAILRAEKEKAAKIEAEIKAQQLAIKLAEEKANLAPEREKILAFSASLWNLSRPEMTTDKGSKLLADVTLNLERLCAYIQNQANNL
jgi:hypothetical protein